MGCRLGMGRDRMVVRLGGIGRLRGVVIEVWFGGVIGVYDWGDDIRAEMSILNT